MFAKVWGNGVPSGGEGRGPHRPPAHEPGRLRHDCPLMTLPVVIAGSETRPRRDRRGWHGSRRPGRPRATCRAIRGLGSPDSGVHRGKPGPPAAGSSRSTAPLSRIPAPHTHHCPLSRVPGRPPCDCRGRRRSRRQRMWRKPPKPFRTARGDASLGRTAATAPSPRRPQRVARTYGSSDSPDWTVREAPPPPA